MTTQPHLHAITQKSSAHGALVGRRDLVAGASSAALAGCFSTSASAASPAWVSAFAVAFVAGWLVEVFKNFNLVPGPDPQSATKSAHERESERFRREGYRVRPIYAGVYSHGELELSEAIREEELRALSTSTHGTNTCTPIFDNADVIALRLITTVLIKKGYSTKDIEACALPIHPSAVNSYKGDRRFSPTYLTPSQGTIAWSTRHLDRQPNLVASLRSPIVRADLRFAEFDGRWKFDFQNV